MDSGLLEDDVVSMVDVLQEDNELEEEARAVLGDSDDQHCTYPAVSFIARCTLSFNLSRSADKFNDFRNYMKVEIPSRTR